jgi:hypothetical protein
MPVNQPGLYGLLAEFLGPTELVEAARSAHQAGYRRVDAYSPFPVDGLAEALGFHRTGMPLVMFLGGLTGAVGGYLMQWWIAAVDYPLNVGGRPLDSWPLFIPVIFEMTVLISALAGVFGLLGLCGLPMPYHPLFNAPRFALASRDRFFLCIESRDPRFDRVATQQFLETLQPREVLEVPT